MMNEEHPLREQMATNIKWSGVGHILGYLLQFVVWVILARLLPTDNFGALGVALAFTNAVNIFGELGMSAAIIQRQDLTAKHCHVMFWTQILISIAFLSLTWICAGSLADYFHNAIIRDLVVLIAARLVVDALGNIQEVLMKRELVFRSLALIEILSHVLFVVVTVTLILRGFNIMALAIGYFAKSILKVVLLWRVHAYRPALGFDRQSFFELFHYGKNVLGEKTLSYLASNISIFLIGRLMGPLALGYYALASSLVNIPREKFGSIISSVAFPAFSRLQTHPEEMRQAYQRLIRYAAAVNFPILVGLMLTAGPFVRVVYTERWEAMILPLRILCIYGACFSLSTFLGLIYNAAGRPDYSFRLSLWNLVGTIAVIVFSLPFGLLGIAVGLSAQALVLNLGGNFLLRKLLGLRFRDYLYCLWPALLCSAAMFVALFGACVVRFMFKLPDLWYLTFAVPLGAVTYGWVFWRLDPQAFQELWQIGQRLVSIRFNAKVA